MATEAELERLVVRLVGDAVSYQQMLQQSIQSTDKAADAITQAASRVERFQLSLQKIGSQAILAGASMDRMFGAKIQAIRDEGLKGFTEAEGAEFRLTSALVAHDRNVRALTEDYKKFASEMQNITTAEDDAVIAALALAEGMGLTADKAKLAVREAQGLAAMKGGGIQSWIHQTTMLGKGSIGRLSRVLGISGEEMEGASSADKLAEAHKTLAGFIRVSQDEIKTYGGQVKQMNNEVGNAKEIIGKFVADGWRPFNAMTIQAARAFQQLDPSTHKLVATTMALGANLGTVVTTMGQTALGVNSLINLYGTLATRQALVTAGSIALKGALAGLAIYGIYYVSNAAYEADINVKRFNAAMIESAGLSEALTKRQASGTAAIMEKAGGISNEDQRRRFLSEELTKAKTEASGYAAAVGRANEEVDQLNTTWNSFVGSKYLEAAKAGLKDQQTLLEGANTRVETLKTALDKLSPEAVDRKTQDLMNEFLQKQQERLLLTKEATESERALQDLRSKGVPESFLEGPARALLNEIEAQDKAIDQRKALNKEIERQVAMEEEEKVQKYNEQLQEGKRVTEEFLTPQEKLLKTQADLQALLEVDAISKSTYDKAMAKARKEAEGMHQAVKNTASAAQSLSGILMGSAEYYGQIEAMRIEGTMEALAPGTAGNPLMPGRRRGAGGIPSDADIAAWTADIAAQSPAFSMLVEGAGVVGGARTPEQSKADQLLQELVQIARQFWKGDATTIEVVPADLGD